MTISIAFGLLAALCFALSTHSQKSALAYLDGITGAFITVFTMAIVFWVGSIWTFKPEYFSSEATVLFVLAGLMFPAVGQMFQIYSVKHVGPALTSAIGAFMPMFAIVPAILFLHEAVTLTQIFGVLLLVGGLILAAVARGVNWRNSAFYLLLLPLGAALARAVAQPLTKAGYNLLAEPFFAMTVMTSVSTLVVGAVLITVGKPRRVLQIGPGHAFFVLNGLLTGAGILSVQLSLIPGSVALTASLVALAPIFTLSLSAFVFKNEILKWSHIVVAGIVCIGAVLVAVGQLPV